jgi:excisionase family DNA binding protein
MRTVNQLMAKIESLASDVSFLMECYRCGVFASMFEKLQLDARFCRTNFLQQACDSLMSNIYDYLDSDKNQIVAVNYLNRIIYRCKKISNSFLDFKDLISLPISAFPSEYQTIAKEFYGEECLCLILQRLYQKKSLIDNLVTDISELVKIMACQEKNQAAYKDILGSVEAANFLGISIDALYKLTSKREMPYHKPSGKIMYFKKTDLENWMLKNRLNSVSEDKSISIAFVVNKKYRKSIS